MGFAPLDVWFRLLRSPGVTVPPRFWPRLALGLLISLLITILSLPERALTALWLQLRKPRRPLPGPVIVLGYYRSGTTLLQNLLSCDPNLYAPHLAHVFMPQGFSLSWAFLRWFLLPFLPRTRPQDNVSMGPLVPAEDDFALNNWTLASTLAGRVVVPQAHRFFDRFHDLKELTPAERRRWACYQLAFVRKLALEAGRRRVLLKTPAHTARIGALLDLFRDTTGVKFLYISRHPHKVFRSNVAMLRLLVDICGLHPPLEQQELEDYLAGEYVATEEEYQSTRDLVPKGSLVEMRLQDLQADPIGTLRRVYAELGLAFTPVFEERLVAYLNANRGFKPNVYPSEKSELRQPIVDALAPLIAQGHHDEPPPARAEVPAPDPAGRRRQGLCGVALGFLVALLLVGPWLLLTAWVGGDSLGAVWPCGVAIGVAVLRGASSRGSAALGLYAALLTALALAAVVGLAHALLPGRMETSPFYLVLGWFWWALALASAYRIGSQRF
jgi:hypothetical protein